MKLNLVKTKTLTLEILDEISKFADEIIEPMTLSGMRRWLYTAYDPAKIQNNFKTLEYRGYIKINRKSDSVVLTNKGKIKLIENSSNSSRDGKWRFLSWDIPEELKNKRQQFCRSIRRIGYKKIQKSLWACPYVRADEVDLIIKEYGIGKYVAYLRVDKTDIESYLNKLFRS